MNYCCHWNCSEAHRICFALYICHHWIWTLCLLHFWFVAPSLWIPLLFQSLLLSLSASRFPCFPFWRTWNAMAIICFEDLEGFSISIKWLLSCLFISIISLFIHFPNNCFSSDSYYYIYLMLFQTYYFLEKHCFVSLNNLIFGSIHRNPGTIYRYYPSKHFVF